jgi:integrase
MPTERDAALTQFFGMCGTRFGEAAALRVADVDLERRRVVIRASLKESSGGRLIEWSTKNRKIRSVPIPSRLVPLLEEQMRGKLPAARVFGEGLRLSNWRKRVFYPAVAGAKLDPPRPTVHDLRHTAASLMIAAGMHSKAVCEALGHSSITITMNRYGHLFESLQDDAGDRYDAFLDREEQRNGQIAWGGGRSS